MLQESRGRTASCCGGRGATRCSHPGVWPWLQGFLAGFPFLSLSLSFLASRLSGTLFLICKMSYVKALTSGDLWGGSVWSPFGSPKGLSCKPQLEPRPLGLWTWSLMFPSWSLARPSSGSRSAHEFIPVSGAIPVSFKECLEEINSMLISIVSPVVTQTVLLLSLSCHSIPAKWVCWPRLLVEGNRPRESVEGLSARMWGSWGFLPLLLLAVSGSPLLLG